IYSQFPTAPGPSPPFQTIQHRLINHKMMSIFTLLASALALSNVAYSVPTNATLELDSNVIYECSSTNLKWAKIDDIQTGANYLHSLSGKATINTKGCDRVSCSWNSAIFYCNDDDVKKEQDWAKLGDGAQLLIDKCGDQGVVKGRVWYKANWHLEVQGDPC
ncbi:hypothetical protein QBC41DRAFT_237235, partial [Cercophora samala]